MVFDKIFFLASLLCTASAVPRGFIGDDSSVVNHTTRSDSTVFPNSTLNSGIVQEENANETLENSIRITNGVPVEDANEYPFVVDLSHDAQDISASRFCTGTLIKENVVLTAAHCILNSNENRLSKGIFATIGRTNLNNTHDDNAKAKTFRATVGCVHPEYESIGSPSDVALLLLDGRSSAKSAELGNHSVEVGTETWVVGYGIQNFGTIERVGESIAVFSQRLQKTVLRVEERSFCNSQSGDLKTPPGMLCTSGKEPGSSACRGDSGGGLFTVSPENSTDRIQVGIVSYGDSQCFSQESGVFTDVAAVRPWIEREVKRLESLYKQTAVRLVMQQDPISELEKGNVVLRTYYGEDDTYAIKGYMYMLYTDDETYNAQLAKVVRKYVTNPSFKSKTQARFTVCSATGSDTEIDIYLSGDSQHKIRGTVSPCMGMASAVNNSYLEASEIRVSGDRTGNALRFTVSNTLM